VLLKKQDVFGEISIRNSYNFLTCILFNFVVFSIGNYLETKGIVVDKMTIMESV
jgi:hypothetical protein